MNNLHYDFHNTGYKIHIPCVDSTEDPLTRRIADFLDQKFGLKTNNAKQYQAGFYKVGSGGETLDGKGITLYGRTQSMQEMQELAQEIEQKFGKELADNVKKYNITFVDDNGWTDVYSDGELAFATGTEASRFEATIQALTCNNIVVFLTTGNYPAE